MISNDMVSVPICSSLCSPLAAFLRLRLQPVILARISIVMDCQRFFQNKSSTDSVKFRGERARVICSDREFFQKKLHNKNSG